MNHELFSIRYAAKVFSLLGLYPPLNVRHSGRYSTLPSHISEDIPYCREIPFQNKFKKGCSEISINL
jgi:hypothetical protein